MHDDVRFRTFQCHEIEAINRRYQTLFRLMALTSMRNSISNFKCSFKRYEEKRD